MPRDRRVTDAVRQLAPYFGAVTDAAFIDQTWDFNKRFSSARSTLATSDSSNIGEVLSTAASLTRGISYETGTPTSDLIANLINGSTGIYSFLTEAGDLGSYSNQIKLYAPNTNGLDAANGFLFNELSNGSALIKDKPTTKDSNFYAAVIRNPFMGPMVKDTGAVEIFMNAIPTLEFSKCVPYINLELISTRRTLGTVAQPLTLLGFLNPPSLGAADQAIIGASSISNVRSEATDLGPGIRSGIELFTAPQTLANMGQTGAEFVPIIDRLRPLASLGNLSLSTKLQGGTLSFTTGRMEIVIHDRSRLREMAAFVRPDLYGTTFLDITYGWSHPDGGLGSSNTFGQFLDALKSKTRYRISNSSFTFEEGGQIKVTLSIQTVGSIDLLYLGPRTEGSSLQKLRQSIELINNRLTELNARGDNPSLAQYDFIGSMNNPDSVFSVASSKEFLTKLREFLAKGSGNQEIINEIYKTFGKTINKSSQVGGLVAAAQDEIRASFKKITATLPKNLAQDSFADPLLENGEAVFGLLGINVVVAQNGNGEAVVGEVTTPARTKQVAKPAEAASSGQETLTDEQKKRKETEKQAEAGRAVKEYQAALSRGDKVLSEYWKKQLAWVNGGKVGPAPVKPTPATTQGSEATTQGSEATTKGSEAAPASNKDAGKSAPESSKPAVTTGARNSVYNDKSSVQADDFYTFGSIFMKMVAEPIRQSGQYEEVQVVFYPFNRYAGAVHDLPVSCFPIEKGRFDKVIEESATKVPELSGRAIIQVLNNRFINFAPSRAYLMSGFYNTTAADEGKTETKDAENVTIKPDTGGKNLTLKTNFTMTLEERMKRAGIPEKKLQLPRVEVAVEGCPLLDANGQPVLNENGQAKTLIKIHVYDATLDPHKTLSEIITATKDNELGMIQVPTADYNKAAIAAKKPTVDGGQQESLSVKAEATKQAAIKVIQAGLESNILEGVSRETLETITSSDTQVKSIIDGIANGTAFVRVKGRYEEIKRLVAAGMPTIIYGSSATAITNASITTGGSAGLPTVMIQRAFNSPGETAAENIESGVPMQILPAQLSLSTIGCPLFSPMQRFFVDFGTGTSLDSCYYVVSVDSTIGNEGYKTDLKMAYSAGFPTYQSLNTQLAQLAVNFSEGSKVRPTEIVTVNKNTEKQAIQPSVEVVEDIAYRKVVSAALAVNRVKRDAEIRAKRVLEKERKRLEMIAAQTVERAKLRAEAAIPESVRVAAAKAAAEKAKAEKKVQEKQAEVSKITEVVDQYEANKGLLSKTDPEFAVETAQVGAAIAGS